MVKFFKKNKIDLSITTASITVTDGVATDTGQDYVDFLRNRNNTSGWMTTESSDAGNTTLVFDLGSPRDIDTLILIQHNFKAFTIQYRNEISLLFQNFSTPIAETVNTVVDSIYSFDTVNTQQVKLIITGTMVADADKSMTQFIMTEIMGTLNCQPVLQPKIDRSRKVTKFLSGKVFITQSVASFEVKIRMNGIVDDTDLTLLETLFGSFDGFLVWLSGGDVAQFDSIRQGYRLQDIFLVAPDGEYLPQYDEGRWKFGVPINISLQEIN